jgi:hypothetical protein
VGQTNSTEVLGTVTANQVSQGLGFNLDPTQDWEFAAAAAAGATHARFDCTWALVEQQTPPPQNAPADPQYAQTSDCVKGFASANRYGIHPTVVAAYGAPYHQILTVTVPGGAPVGSTSLNIEFVSGVGGDTLANIRYPYTYLEAPSSITAGSYNKLTNHASYAGSFITGVTMTDRDHATIQLASATLDALPADGTQYQINEILYPSALTTSPTDPSVIEYGNYVSFLANDMAARGVTGEIEIWNEPPWLQDPWDDRGDLYDQNLWPGPQKPGPSAWISANYGFVGDLQNRTFPQGITATWNGTSGSGYGSVLGPNMLANTGVTLKQPSTVITKESFHPYGTTPEQGNWIAPCLEKVAAATSYPANEPGQCLLSGEAGGNAIYAILWDEQAKLKNPAFGVAHSVSETGSLPLVPGLRIPQARFIIRQFLAFQADGITPVEFEQLYDATTPNDPNFSFVEEAGNTSFYSANPSYTSISGFMSDINQISNLPVATYDTADLASVSSYTGQYPLTSVHIVGSRATATANSEMFAVWQRSTTPCTASGNCGVQEDWLTQASPAPAPITVQIPSGESVTSAINLTTRIPVPYTMSGQTMSFFVADDPVGILIDPASAKATSRDTVPTTLTVAVSGSGSNYGSSITLTAQLTPSSGSVKAANGEVVSFYDGQTLLGTGRLVSGTAQFNATTIPVGMSEVVAQYAGDATLTASTGFTSVTVHQANPGLQFSPVSAQFYGVAPFRVIASSASRGVIEYSVVSGPAGLSESSTSSGAMVGISAIGTVTLQAYQFASGNYASATAQLTFTVNPATPTLTFNPIPTAIYGKNISVYVGASSVSHGAITYSVVSGPATISGNVVRPTGIGTVTIAATQAAYGNYTAASVQASFAVTGQTATLQITQVASQTYGAGAISLSATSSSPAAITYSVVSGPATVVGSKLKITGAGTVIVGASQAATGSYPAATAEMTFVVNPAVPTLTFKSIPNQVYSTQPIALSATSNSPAAITYAILNGPATVSGSTLMLSGAGSVTVQVSQPASANYVAASAQASFVVSGLTPLLKIAQVPTQTFGASALTLSATSSSSAAITYSLVNGPATVSGSTVQITGAGTVVIGANQAAAGDYTAATAQMTFVVNPAVPTLTFTSIPNQAYSTQPIALTATSNSPAPLAYTVLSGPATVSGSTLKLSGVGSVVVKVSQVASGNYAAASAQTSFVVTGSITAQCQTIDYTNGFTSTGLTLNNGASITNGLLQLTDGKSNEARSAFSSTMFPISTFTSDFTFQELNANADGFTFVLQSNKPTAVGLEGGDLGYGGIPKSMALKFDLHDNQGEGPDSTGIFFNGVMPAAPALNLAPANLDLHSGHVFSAHVAYANALTTVTLTDTVTGATVSWSSAGDISGVIGSSAYVGFTGGAGGPSAVQNILTWSFSAGSGCAVTIPTTGNAAQTIGFGSIPNTTYGAGPITLSATATSGLPVSYTVTGPALLSGNSLLIEGAGQVTVTASQPGNASFAPATPVSKSFNVAKAPLVVTANNQFRAVGSSTFNQYYSVSGLVNGDFQTVLGGTATLTTDASSTASPGTYPITFQTENLTAINYTVTYVTGVLTIQ